MGACCSDRSEGHHREKKDRGEDLNESPLVKYFYRYAKGMKRARGIVLHQAAENMYVLQKVFQEGCEPRTEKIITVESGNDISKVLAQREIDLFLKHKHPQILRLAHVEEFCGEIVLTFEESICTLLQEMNEKFKLAKGLAYKEAEVGMIMLQILSLLDYLHRKKYIHRDIKPENFVLVPENGYPMSLRLCSFSTAEFMDKEDVIKGVVGTYLYMAPEMLQGKQYDTSVDIWSAGIIMYMLLTGEHPLTLIEKKDKNARSCKDALIDCLMAPNLQVVDSKKEEVNYISVPCRRLLESMLEIDPKTRITAERALKDPWLHDMVAIKRNPIIAKIEHGLRASNPMVSRAILMNVVSAVSASNLKIILLDRMCSSSKYARENKFPSLDKSAKKIYNRLFFLIDKDYSGSLSKDEVYSFNSRFPFMGILKKDLYDHLEDVKSEEDEVIGYTGFMHAAAMYDLKRNPNKIDEMFNAMASGKKDVLTISDLLIAHKGVNISSKKMRTEFAEFISANPNLSITLECFKAYMLDTSHKTPLSGL